MNSHFRVLLQYMLVCGLTLSGCAAPAAQVEPSAAPAAAVSPPPTAIPPTTPPPTPLPSPAPAVVVINADNLNKLTVTHQVQIQSPGRILWSQTGVQIGVVTSDGLKVYDAASLAVFTTVEVKSPYYLLDYAPQTNLIAVATSQTTLDLREADTGKTRHTLDIPSGFMRASFSPNGQLLAVPAVDQIAVTVWNTQTGEQTTTLSGFETAAPVYNGVFSGSDRTLLWISRATVQLMDIQNGKLGPRLEHEDFVGSALISPDERILATSAAATVENDYKPVVKLWNAASGAALGTLALNSQDGIPGSLAFSPDGRLLAVPQSNQISLWDIASQQKLTTLQGPTDRVSSVSFSPDGITLAAGSADQTIRLWQVTP